MKEVAKVVWSWFIIGSVAVAGYQIGKKVNMTETKNEAYKECYDALAKVIGDTIEEHREVES